MLGGVLIFVRLWLFIWNVFLKIKNDEISYINVLNHCCLLVFHLNIVENYCFKR